MRLAFIDKDWTLVKPKSGDTFVQSPDDQELLPGVLERLTELEDAEYKPVIISNQQGVQKGYKTLQNAIDEMRYCLELTGIERAYFCPDEGHSMGYVNLIDEAPKPLATHKHPIFRKPAPGMPNVVMELLGAVPSDCLFIGDMESDRQCADNAKVPFIHVDDWLQDGLKSLLIGH